MDSSVIDDLAQVLGTTEELVDAIGDGHWELSTPCSDWTVRQLVNHLVLGHRLYSGILTGQLSMTPGALDPTITDVLGAFPASTYRKATADLLTALRRPGTLQRSFVVPVGPVSGVAAVHLRIAEELVHGYDLGQAIGLPTRFPADIVERSIVFTAGKLADVDPDRSPFGAPQPVDPDAQPILRLAALLGRPVSG
ncbi:TIGR03086 family protein [Pseudonocardiaceae bacterium YIM PH 21723]|nr:TIGR03086 family protein [Pseudonocardiaceae bacterium YIM PH 21723]